MKTDATPGGGGLVRVVGVWGAVWMGLGSILGTGVFVSLGIAAGVVGSWVVLAVGLATLPRGGRATPGLSRPGVPRGASAPPSGRHPQEVKGHPRRQTRSDLARSSLYSSSQKDLCGQVGDGDAWKSPPGFRTVTGSAYRTALAGSTLYPPEITGLPVWHASRSFGRGCRPAPPPPRHLPTPPAVPGRPPSIGC